MLKKIVTIIFALILYGGINVNLYSADWITSDKSERAYIQLQNAPFPHESRKNGYSYNDKIFPFDKHYNDSTVGFLIPKDYKPQSKTDFLIFFHGHDNNVDNAISQFHLDEMLNNCGKNVIMLFPQGPKNVPDSSCGKLEEPLGFTKFMDEAFSILKKEKKIPPKAEIGKIILSGHSGAYRVLGNIIAKGGYEKNIKELFLFDSTYGQLQVFADWSKSSKHRLFSIFTDHLAPNNAELMALLQKNGIKKFAVIKDEDLTEEILEKNRILFSYTTLGHNFVMNERKHFEKLLRTGCLKNK